MGLTGANNLTEAIQQNMRDIAQPSVGLDPEDFRLTVSPDILELFQENLEDIADVAVMSLRNAFDGPALGAAEPAVSAVHKQEHAKVEEQLLAGGGENSSVAGRIETGAGAAQAASSGSKAAEEEKARKKGMDNVVLLAMLDQIADLNNQIAANNERIEELERQEAGLEQTIEDMENGKPVVDEETGELKNKDAEAAVKEYEQKHGVKVDRTNPDVLKEILGGVRAEKQVLEKSNDDLAVEVEQREFLANNPEELARRGNATQEERDINNGAVSDLESDEEQVEMVQARDFDEVTEQIAVDASVDNEGNNLFSELTVGSENPFTSGDVRNEFFQRADVQTQNTPDVEQEIREEFNPNRFS